MFSRQFLGFFGVVKIQLLFLPTFADWKSNIPAKSRCFFLHSLTLQPFNTLGRKNLFRFITVYDQPTGRGKMFQFYKYIFALLNTYLLFLNTQESFPEKVREKDMTGHLEEVVPYPQTMTMTQKSENSKILCTQYNVLCSTEYSILLYADCSLFTVLSCTLYCTLYILIYVLNVPPPCPHPGQLGL